MISRREELDYLYEESKREMVNNNLQKAARGFLEAQKGYDELGECFLSVRAQNLLGVSYAAMSNESMAVDCYLKGLDYVRDHGIKGAANLFYNNIGTRYQELGDDATALHYFLDGNDDLDENGKYFQGMDNTWYVVGYLNIGVAYFHLGELKEAENYLLKAEKMAKEEKYTEFDFSISCLLSRVYLAMGSETYTREHLEEMLAHASITTNTLNDYTQDIMEFTSLLKEIKEYDLWKQCLLSYQKIVDDNNIPVSKLQATEFWLDYYDTIGMKEEWKNKCVEHTLLYKEVQIQNQEEKILVLNLKIELFKVRDEKRDAEEKSQTDALTCLKNRYAMYVYSERILAEGARLNTPVMVGLMDIDCFKTMNDTYGHLRGDDALKQVSSALFESVDGYGEAFRFGGDEFVIVVPNSTEDMAERISRKVSRAIENLHIENVKSPVSPELTVSMGISCRVPNIGDTIDRFIDEADTILYSVKKKGRKSIQLN